MVSFSGLLPGTETIPKLTVWCCMALRRVVRPTTRPTLTFVVVASSGSRDQLWNDRLGIASRLLGGEVAWSHDLPWQGDFRYQAWRSDLLGVDLTFDEGRVEPHETFASGEPDVIAGDLSLPAFTEPDRRAAVAALDMETWIWFLGVHNQLRQGRVWPAYCQLVELLDARLASLVDRSQLQVLAPKGVAQAAIEEALQATVRAYQRATAGLEVERSQVLASAIQSAILGAPTPSAICS